MGEYTDLIERDINYARTQAASSVTASVDASPDDAARAFELAQDAGIPAAQIYDNLDSFQRFNKASMSSAIVQGNRQLQDYANSHPLAPKISNDDWGNLDNMSRAMDKIPEQSSIAAGIRAARDVIEKPINTVGDAISSSFGPQRLGSWIPESTYQEMMQSKQGYINYLLLSTAFAAPELGFRSISAGVHGVAAGIGSAYNAVTGRPQSDTTATENIEQFINDPNTMVMTAGLTAPVALGAYLARGQAMLRRARPYTDAGIEPPRGIDPIIDHAKAAQTKADVDSIMDALREAQKSNTRDRNPEMFANFLRQHNTQDIGINVDAVRRLYGDTAPMPDDGILGWVPGIEDKIYSGAWDHGDVKVPLADWLAHVEPDVAKELKDFIRVRPGDFTLDEAKGLPPIDMNVPRPQLPDEPTERVKTLREMEEAQGTPRAETLQMVDGVRDSAGLGPKVKLVSTMVGEGDLAGTHEFDIMGRDGQKLGDAQVSLEGTNIHVDYARGLDGLWSLGPSVILDVGKQLREQFPQARTISGVRISGAREGMEVGPVDDVTKDPRYIKRSLYPFAAHAEFHDIFEPQKLVEDRGDKLKIGQYIVAEKNPKFTENQEQINTAIQKVIDKVAPGLKGSPTAGLQVTGRKAYGVYHKLNHLPFILWSMDAPDVIGVARHEIIHYLRQNEFFTKKEWGLLRDQAIKEDWLNKYDIHTRYKNESLPIKIEEAVAEHFRRYNQGEETPAILRPIMERLKALYESIRTTVRGFLGKDADYRDVLSKIEKGEIGERLPGEDVGGPREGLAEAEPAAQRPEQLEMEQMTRMEDRALFAKANAIGMTVKAYKQMMERAAERDKADMEFADQQNRKQITRRQTEEWKAKEKEVREELRQNLEQRPDLAADKFIREGILHGQKIEGSRPKLDSGALTEDQRRALPRDYHAGGGIHPDDMASLFGYHSGDELVNRLGQLQVERGNLKPGQYLQKVLSQETARRMFLEHGDLAQNILSEAEDHVISRSQLDYINEELFSAATKAGMELSFTKENIDKLIKDNFEKMDTKGLATGDFLRNALKASELALRAEYDGDTPGVVRQLEAQRFALGYAKQMKEFERVLKKFNKLTNKYKDREPSGVDPTYVNYIHQLMKDFGIPVNRSVGDLATELGKTGEGTLREFIDHIANNNGGAKPAIDDRILDPSIDPNFVKPVTKLNVEDFRVLNDALITLDQMGRMSKKVIVAGKVAELSTVTQGMIDQLEEGYDPKNPTKSKGPYRDFLRKWITIGSLSPETWANRIDRDNIHGWFNQWLVRPMSTAANREARLGREYGKRLLDLGEVRDGETLIRSPFTDPNSREKDGSGGTPYVGFNRKNVAAMISNAGNEYNWDVLTKGLGADPAALKQWLAANTTKEDWVRAEKLGGIFNDMFEEAQDVYRSVYGTAPPKIDLQPFSIRLADGTEFKSEGWYHPIIRDSARTERVRPLTGQELLEQDKGLYASVANGYTKRRTGKIDVLDLTHEMIPYKMTQIVHDIAFRAEIIETAKILRDKDLKFAIRSRMGEDFVKMFDSWVSDVAGRANMYGPSMQATANLANYIRTNAIGTLIGFNPSTVMKHAPTALINSMYEVGLTNYLKAMGSTSANRLRIVTHAMFGGDEELMNNIHKFIDENSEEIQRRDRNWQESFGGAQKILEGKSSWRDRIIQYGSKPVAMSDMLSARPTWLAAYLKEIEDGGSHGDAVFAGDRAVRRAHGSTAITNLPELVRQSGPYGSFATSLYGFFSAQMQRRAEIAFKLNDTYKLGREGELKEASKKLASVVPLVFASMIWPSIIEEAVTSIGTEDHRSGLMRLAQAGWTGMAASFLFLRDIAHGIGLAQTIQEEAMKTATEVASGRGLSREHAGKTVQDLITTVGIAKGWAPAQVGRVVRFGMGMHQGTERPQGLRDYGVGFMRGTLKPRIQR